MTISPVSPGGHRFALPTHSPSAGPPRGQVHFLHFHLRAGGYFQQTSASDPIKQVIIFSNQINQLCTQLSPQPSPPQKKKKKKTFHLRSPSSSPSALSTPCHPTARRRLLRLANEDQKTGGHGCEKCAHGPHVCGAR